MLLCDNVSKNFFNVVYFLVNKGLCDVPTKVGLLLVQARNKACMGWSWATACSAQGRGHIVAASHLQLVRQSLTSVPKTRVQLGWKSNCTVVTATKRVISAVGYTPTERGIPVRVRQVDGHSG